MKLTNTSAANCPEIVHPPLGAVWNMKLTNTSTASQRALIKALLRKRPHSTLELRAKGICSPAPRIMELKKQGYEIITSTRTEVDQSGIKHNGIAVYTLLSEPQQETQGEQHYDN